MHYRLRKDVYKCVRLVCIRQNKVEHLQDTHYPYLLALRPE